MSKVGVLGGTFDPLHIGHLRAAEVARDVLALDSVLFVPAANPPHKQGVSVTDATARVEMLELALSGEMDFELCRAEIDRGGSSYTIETLDELQSRDESAELWFITGSDAFLEIRTWKNWQMLLERYSFAVHERPGVGIDAAAGVVPEHYRKRIVFMTRDMLNISSTEIRGLAQAQRSIRFLVPQAVDDYVRRNHLYQ